MAHVRKALTFSNVVACIALFVALGGSVYAAGKINGKQIKKSSLPGNRIKPKTVKANRIKPKTLTGRQVRPRSLTGRQINQATLNEVSAARLAGVHYQTSRVSLPPGWPATRVTADCPTGTYVVGGGATMSREEAQVLDSGPASLRTGWTASGTAWFSNNTTMTVTAICVAVSKPSEGSQPAAAVSRSGPVYQSAP
jgi:hypothetical protein